MTHTGHATTQGDRRERKKHNPRFPASETKHKYRYITREPKPPKSAVPFPERLQFVGDAGIAIDKKLYAELPRLLKLCDEIGGSTDGIRKRLLEALE